MNKCPVHNLKPMPPLPARIARLPIAPNGYPQLWFVSIIDGKPDFRIADTKKLYLCVQRKLCWVCGEPLGVHMCFVIGPMCTVNRVSADPPAHWDCAEFSVKACPFLTRPHMVRREDELSDSMKGNTAGIMIERNPGVMAVWNTKSYKLRRDQGKGVLFALGPAEEVTWWREGRPATRIEVLEGFKTGMPILRNMCDDEKSLKALKGCYDEAMKLIPLV